MKISLAIIVKNEEKYIERCLQSVSGLVDEIVAVDTGSTDNTVPLIKGMKNVKLYHFEWCDDFSLARNFSIEKTTGDYVLVLDADEYIVNGTRIEMESIMAKDIIGRIQINSRFKKDNQEHHSKSYVSRFFPRDVRYKGAIHEQLDSERPRINTNFIVSHDGYFETNKSERNIPLLQKALERSPMDGYYLFQLGKELRISKQYEEAFSFLKKSYELTNNKAAYYSELVVELINSGKECGKAEILLVINQNEDILGNVSDFHFAKGMFYLDYCLNYPNQAQQYIRSIESSFLSCLKLNQHDPIEFVQGTSSYLAMYNLGIYYEVTGYINEAMDYYAWSSEYGYLLAKRRLQELIRDNKRTH
ncbi:glycosyltransferase [Neobacillus muris]|uniref:glycosyltransferase n=1 Tax=Neobacillus muris TaxID=2941334 RepID=UPI00204015B4|nr:glycosyltransferase family 2 protein [Neobacillus muris]